VTFAFHINKAFIKRVQE